MDIHDAILEGNVEIVKCIISNIENIFGGDPIEYALHYACEFGKLEIVKLLCHYVDEYAVQLAAREGHYEVVKYLCEVGADIRSNNDLAVQYASVNEHFEVVKYLIEKGADVSKIFYQKKYEKYILFCEKMEKKIRERAQKKIYFWWIPICYSLDHPSGCGKRMMMKNLDKAMELGLELN